MNELNMKTAVSGLSGASKASSLPTMRSSNASDSVNFLDVLEKVMLDSTPETEITKEAQSSAAKEPAALPKEAAPLQTPVAAATTVDLDAIFDKAAETYGVSSSLLKAMAKAESGFNPNAVSSSGAQGIMQLMPATSAALGVSDPFNPEQNIMGGAKYISDKIKQYGGDVTLALASYQAGSGNVKKYGGVPPFKSTQTYINKVLSAANSSISAGTAVVDSSHAVTYGTVAPAKGAASGTNTAATVSPGSSGASKSSAAQKAAQTSGSDQTPQTTDTSNGLSNTDITELLEYYQAMMGASALDGTSSLSSTSIATVAQMLGISGSTGNSVLSELSGISGALSLSDIVSNTDMGVLASSGMMSDWLAATNLSEDEDNGFNDLINAYNKYNRLTINTILDANDDEQEML